MEMEGSVRSERGPQEKVREHKCFRIVMSFQGAVEDFVMSSGACLRWELRSTYLAIFSISPANTSTVLVLKMSARKESHFPQSWPFIANKATKTGSKYELWRSVGKINVASVLAHREAADSTSSQLPPQRRTRIRRAALR